MSRLPAAWLLGIAVALAVVAAGWGTAWFLRCRKELDYQLRKIAWARLVDVVIPDEFDGEIHLDLALLTPRGILVLEVRHAAGTLFWGEQLDSWTLLDGVRRKVMPNPLPGLQARRDAVHALAPRVPVDGLVLLVGPVTVSGRTPPGVVLMEDLLAAFPAAGKGKPPPELAEAWAGLAERARSLRGRP